jgi:hypothetical protein
MEITKMENRNIKDGVRIRRSVYIPFDLAQRVDVLIEKGTTTSNIIGAALRRSLTTIENQIAAGKDIPGIKIRKEV